MNPNNVAIVIGHDSMSKGAYSNYIGSSEYDYNLEAANMVGCDIYTHSFNTSYRRKMKATYSKLSHYDLTLELHFNAATPNACGAEALYFHTNAEGKRFAQLFANMTSRRFGTRNRGAKPLSNVNQRGYWAVASGIPTGLILEPFFGSNSEAVKFQPHLYAELLKEYISEL